MAKNSDPKIEFLRHALATVAYRGAKAMRGARQNSRNLRRRIRHGLLFRSLRTLEICTTGR